MYAHKFKNAEAKQALVTKFPIALKTSKTTTPKESQEWLQVVVEQDEEADREINPEDITILHTQQRMEWKYLCYKALSLSDKTYWKLFVLILIIINFFQVSYAYIFLRDAANMTAYYSIFICDLVYGFDFGLSVVVYFCKDLQLQLVNPPRSKFILICDGLLVFPYSFIYELIYRNTNTMLYISLRAVSFLRLYHLVCFFQEKSKSAGICHWKYFIAEYFSYFFLLQHSIACIWYLLACPLGCSTPGGWSSALQNLNRYPTTQFEWYIICMYFALTNITTVGFGDVTATNSIERIVAGKYV